jgi:hypothetical protein
MYIRYQGVFVISVVMILLSACARPAGGVVPTATSAACDIGVNGRWIVDGSGEPLILYGANLPSLTEMEASTYPAADRLHDLAAAGATLVRLRVDFREVSPTFVPAKVVPFVQQANQLGMLVILGWSTVISGSVDDAVDDAEDWVRQEFTYLSNNPGVWFDLYAGVAAQDVSPTRQRNITQRLVDVARGYRANNVIVVNDPAWLLDQDPAINRPLSDSRIVYGLDGRAGATAGLQQAGTAGGYDVTKYPFIVTRWDGDQADLASLHSLQVGALVNTVASPIPAALSDFWKANHVDLETCHPK